MKKQGRSQPFAPPTVRVTLIQGDRLAAATAALAEQQTAADRAAEAAVEAERAKLQPTLAAAAKALETLSIWSKEHADELKLLRDLQLDGSRGVVDEGLRVSASNRVENIGKIIQATKETLATAPQRAQALNPRDLEGPRMHIETAGIKTYTDLPFAATEAIKLDVERAVRTVGQLDQILAEAQGAVERVAAALEKAQRIRAREGAVPGAALAGGSIVDPDELQRLHASRPGDVQRKADAEFSGYAADNLK